MVVGEWVVGSIVGAVGSTVGIVVGAFVGAVGSSVGAKVGSIVGAVGSIVGSNVGSQLMEALIMSVPSTTHSPIMVNA